MIFQEPMSSLNPLHTIHKQLHETLFLHQGLTARQATPLALEWLHRVGINDPERRLNAFPHQLSGGERQRVMIAMALINAPKLLIADEPTTALDVTIQAQILRLMKQLQQELGMAMLFITHDLNIVRRIADRVAVMQQGQIVETNTTAALFAEPQHLYTRQLLNSEPQGEPPASNPTAIPLLTLQDLKVWFPIQKGILRRTQGYVKAVDGVTLSLRQGQTLGIVGESGSGKTTLGKAILRLEQSTGQILFEQVDLRALKEAQLCPLRQHLQIIFQDPFGSLNPRLSIAQIIGEGLMIHHIGDSASQIQRIIVALNEVGLDPERRHQFPHEFSGGERQRIAIARALVLQPKLIILDEPTSSLDRSIQFQVIALLKQLQAKYGLTYVFISHDLKLVTSLCHEIMIMRHGQIVETGPTRQILRHPQQIYTQELLATAFDQGVAGN
jgi:microcin C transport system ATP-binding protein